jgi:hypothetical protein
MTKSVDRQVADKKSDRIRVLLRSGFNVAEIVALTNVQRNRVYRIAKQMSASEVGDYHMRGKTYLNGSNLIIELQAVGMKNADIAYSIGSTPEQLSRWKSGKRMRPEVFEKLQALLSLAKS